MYAAAPGTGVQEKRTVGTPRGRKLAPEGGVRRVGLSTGGGQSRAEMVTLTTSARGPSPRALTALNVIPALKKPTVRRSHGGAKASPLKSRERIPNDEV
jgi:hypothetical protein